MARNGAIETVEVKLVSPDHETMPDAPYVRQEVNTDPLTEWIGQATLVTLSARDAKNVLGSAAPDTAVLRIVELPLNVGVSTTWTVEIGGREWEIQVATRKGRMTTLNLQWNP